MSKRSLFWGQASGKLGEAVYYRAGGEQRTRAYTATVKNPKSRNQAIQRTKMNNLVAVFKATKPAVNSFMIPSKSGRSAFNEFTAENIRRATYLADQEMVQLECGGANGYVLANGKLGELLPASVIMGNASIQKTESKYAVGFVVPETNVSIADLPEAYKTLLTEDMLTPIATGKEVYSLLVNASNSLMLPTEFNVSFVHALDGAAGIGYRVYTVKCSSESTDVLRCVKWMQGEDRPVLPHILIFDGTPNSTTPAEITEYTGVSKFTICDAAGYESEDLVNEGLCAIISYKDASGVQVSRSVMVYGQIMAEEALKYALNGEYAEDIISAYEIKSDKLTE